MKNIINEKPLDNLNGRLLASVKFVENADVVEKNILDIGCGFGWCELNFLNRGVSAITGLEISENNLETIRNNINDERVKLTVGDAKCLPFENKIFDTVIAWEVLEHITNGTENKMFKEVGRVLKPDGVFYFSTPHSSFFSNIMDPAWWLTGHRHYSRNELLKYVENNNFDIIKVETKGGWWVLFSILNMYISKWIFRREPFFFNEFKERENGEYKNNNGFVNIFIKLKKR